MRYGDHYYFDFDQLVNRNRIPGFVHMESEEWAVRRHVFTVRTNVI